MGNSKSYKERKKHRTRLKNLNKTPYQNKNQEASYKEVKNRERETARKHREMYS